MAWGASKMGNPRTAKATSRKEVRHRRLLITAVLLGAVMILTLAGAAWLGSKASLISSELRASNKLVSQLQGDVLNEDAEAATKTVAKLQEHTSKARDAATDPLWTMGAALPWVGPNLQATSEVAVSADDVAKLAAGPLINSFKSLDWTTLLPHGQQLNLKPLIDAQPDLGAAARAVRQSSDRLNAIDSNILVPQISAPLIQAREQLNTLRDSLDSAADAATILPAMLGGESPRRYLVLIQNSAEVRATGGIPGALAVLSVNHGRLSLSQQTSATALGTFEPVLQVDAEQKNIFSGRLGKFMQDVNLTPDFPTAAQTAWGMWERKTGEKLDGVLSIDPIGLAYILEATGPVQVASPLSEGTSAAALPNLLTADNVVPTLLSDVYSKISLPAEQDVYFAGVAQEVFAKLSSGGGDAKKLIDGLTRGTAERRILLWSSKTNEQAVVSKYPVGGSVTRDSISPTQFGVYFNDGTGAKMDYHIQRKVQLVEECPVNDYARVKVRVTSTNTAPEDAATSLPEYVTGGGAFGVPAGSVQTNIVAYGPVQSNVETAFVAGKKTGFASHRHAGRPVGSVTVRLAPGQSSVVEFSFGKIVQHADPVVAVTPTVQALNEVIMKAEFATCGPPA